MKICEDRHKKIVHTEKVCPLCEQREKVLILKRDVDRMNLAFENLNYEYYVHCSNSLNVLHKELSKWRSDNEQN